MVFIFFFQQNGGNIEEQSNEDVASEWFEALRADNLNKVKQLLKTGNIDVNCKDQVSYLSFSPPWKYEVTETDVSAFGSFVSRIKTVSSFVFG